MDLSTSMHPEQHLSACACSSLSKACLEFKALRHVLSFLAVW